MPSRGWRNDRSLDFQCRREVPLQSNQARNEDCKDSRAFLARYQQRGNPVILVRHDIAECVRNDFPEFEIEASVIHQVRSVDRLPRLADIFDTVVLHPCLNDQTDVLSTIARKDTIRRFANAGCMAEVVRSPCMYQGQQGLSGAVGVTTAGRPEDAIEQISSTLPVALVVPP